MKTATVNEACKVLLDFIEDTVYAETPLDFSLHDHMRSLSQPHVVEALTAFKDRFK